MMEEKVLYDKNMFNKFISQSLGHWIWPDKRESQVHIKIKRL